MARFIRTGIICASFFVASLCLWQSSPVAALVGQNAQQAACQGVTLGQSNSCPDTSSSLNHILTTVINILSIIVGVAAVIMIVIGGFKFVTSSGESSNIASARNTIIYALIGLIIVALAQAMVHFVLNSATKAAGSIISHQLLR